MLNRDLIEKLKQKSKRKGKLKDKILGLKDEILELRKEGLSLSAIVEYLKEEHKIRTTAEYIKKLIPEVAKETKVNYAFRILNSMNNNELAQVWKLLGKERLREIWRVYKQKYENNTENF